MQPYFLPYLGYWQLMSLVDEWIIFDGIDYRKKNWINRNRISRSTGGFLWINIPVKSISSNILINQVQIHRSIPWENKILENFKLTFKKSPFFNEANRLLVSIFQCKERSLSNFIINSIYIIKEALGINCKIEIHSKNFPEINRNNFKMDAGKWALEMAFASKSTCYVNPDAGRHLFNPEKFNERGIKLEYYRYEPPVKSHKKLDEFWNYSIIEIIARFGILEVKKFLQIEGKLNE